ncbi:cadmium-induced protein AS8 isoform X2 [Mercurialis annua]|nr:cadmium-induced protein AS8 isoform X2 [Mercurialis annua]XP_055962141.1 cadmium-induced protein AS8 isoform X2 [Mercurialis annua]
MIIKGLFRRYERWNPVHPTLGAFWGMGLGFGCGVGWGPGFGPEVIGYVGAGCGVGFSVGITFAGFGIGLPANYIFQLPYSAIVATSNQALPFFRSSPLLNGKDVTGNGLNDVSPGMSFFPRETSRRFSSSNQKALLDMQRTFSVHAKSFSKDLETFCSQFFHPRKGQYFISGWCIRVHNGSDQGPRD